MGALTSRQRWCGRVTFQPKSAAWFGRWLMRGWLQSIFETTRFSMPNRCVMCGADSESVHHIFWLCPFACEVWSFFSSRFSLLGSLPINAKGFMWAWKGLNCEASLRPCVKLLVHSVLWVLWSERNTRIFQDKSDDLGGGGGGGGGGRGVSDCLLGGFMV
ncbi:hypothetical protein LINPERPRIM_LOCUS24357 [Linum perenne]